MKLSALHLLLTYQCTLECDHCFVWGSPRQDGTMTLAIIDEILRQALAMGTVSWIYFEGGEPFLYYPIMLEGTRRATAAGLQVGLVTNSFWATDVADAQTWLEPLAGLIQDLSISSDQYHWGEKESLQASNVRRAAQLLDLPLGTLSVSQPGQAADDETPLMYRGRAAVELAPSAPSWQDWQSLIECPYENLRDPGRVHVDPFGWVHLCNGVTVGNLLQQPLAELAAAYDPDAHPVIGPLLAGGPAELVRRYDLAHEKRYADACHLCYQARLALRERFPAELAPDQVYGLTD